MRISDWSSDVCSSDFLPYSPLSPFAPPPNPPHQRHRHPRKNDANRAPNSWRTRPNGDHNHEVHAEMPQYLATYRKAAIRVLGSKNQYCLKHRAKTAEREKVGGVVQIGRAHV